jgi:hypothetical protein
MGAEEDGGVSLGGADDGQGDAGHVEHARQIGWDQRDALDPMGVMGEGRGGVHQQLETSLGAIFITIIHIALSGQNVSRVGAMV